MKAVSSAARATFFILCLAAASFAWAAGQAASVLSLSGTVSAQRPDGSVRLLAKGSSLMAGEIVLTEKGSSARLRFNDDSEINLRASSRLVIESFSYDEGRPADDAMVVNLLKGGMRAVSGAVGKRGNVNAYQAKTNAGTIGIRGTDYALLQCQDQDENCLSALKLPLELRALHKTLPAGVYLTVFEGRINAANQAGSKDFREGQSGYIRDANTPPQELSEDPGLLMAFSGLSGFSSGTGDIFGSPDAACLVH